MINIMVAIEY